MTSTARPPDCSSFGRTGRTLWWYSNIRFGVSRKDSSCSYTNRTANRDIYTNSNAYPDSHSHSNAYTNADGDTYRDSRTNRHVNACSSDTYTDISLIYSNAHSTTSTGILAVAVFARDSVSKE